MNIKRIYLTALRYLGILLFLALSIGGSVDLLTSEALALSFFEGIVVVLFAVVMFLALSGLVVLFTGEDSYE